MEHVIMNNNGSIYLSGGMEKSLDSGAAWRKTCSIKLEELNFFPLDIAALDLAYIQKHGPVYLDKDPANFLQYKSNIRRQFIYTDLRLIIDDADAVIAYYDQSFKDGAGSFAECQCAYDNEKPLFVMSQLDHVPSWLKSLSTKLFYNWPDLYSYLGSLPKDILKNDRYGNHSSHDHYLCSLCGEIFEKKKHHFVSKVSPLYCKSCVDLVMNTREKHADRYQFIAQHIKTLKDE